MNIQFCGGCNPRIERGRIAEKLRGVLEKDGISVLYNADHADFTVYLSGCRTCCALKYHPPFSEEHVVVAGETVDYERVEESSIVEKVMLKMSEFSRITDPSVNGG